MNDELVVEPNKLQFNGPLTRTVTVEISLYNPTAQVIAFKVKTIEPDRYLVKPSKGIIGPEQNATVTVHMLPLEDESLVEHFITSKQKFMVERTIDDDSVLDTNRQMHRVKLDCEFNDQLSQSQEKSTSYKSVKLCTHKCKHLPPGSIVCSPAPRSPSSRLEPDRTTQVQATLASPSHSGTRLMATVVSASLALLLAFFLAYNKFWSTPI